MQKVPGSKLASISCATWVGKARIRLGWVKAHIGIKGNEIADTLAKEATTDGIPASLPFPKSFLKKQLLQLSLARWQAEWDNGETGRSVYSIIPKISNKQLHWCRECIQFATGHGPFPRYFKRFGLHSTDYCGCGEIGNPPTLCNEMSTYFILSLQGTKSTIHSPLVEECPIQKTLKKKYR
ncbi:hypothetical protein AVEN_51508-1 [Araneus ventricosus]|uniref:RNase H type-1 domain-containing protein n=1 Tax=Araneus ventricosus TaxID=182803 RepID=A0A4Y2GLM1_ARAVE|nr:hypothetical protein AVEN_51508-1 [Araneus ventricosus]